MATNYRGIVDCDLLFLYQKMDYAPYGLGLLGFAESSSCSHLLLLAARSYKDMFSTTAALVVKDSSPRKMDNYRRQPRSIQSCVQAQSPGQDVVGTVMHRLLRA